MPKVEKAKKKKKKKLRVKVLLKLMVGLLAISLFVLYFANIPIKNIYIKGNSQVSDVEIIELAGIKDYPKIYKVNKNKIVKSLKSNPLIQSVKVKKNIWGKLTINVVERNILFFYKYNNKFMTSDGNFIADNILYKGYPTLVNFTPDTVLEELVKGLNKVNKDIVKMISEFEYFPYKTEDGKMIDQTRFKLLMNDGNTVYIDTANIRNLNKYTEIYASLNMDSVKGILYLDTITDDNILFESYSSANAINEELAKNQEKIEE